MNSIETVRKLVSELESTLADKQSQPSRADTSDAEGPPDAAMQIVRRMREALRNGDAPTQAPSTDMDAVRRIALEHSPVMITVWKNDTLVYVSPGVGVVLGYEPEELFSINPFSLVHPEDLDPLFATISAHRNDAPDTVSVYQYRYLHKDGGYRHLRNLLCRPLREDDAAITVISSVDVSDLIEAAQTPSGGHHMAPQNANHEKLLRTEMSHRVKNHLNTIAGIAALELSEPERSKEDSLSSLISRIHAIAEVHRALYEGSSLGRVELPTFIRNLMDKLASAFSHSRNVAISVNAVPLEVSMKTATHLGLTLSELVSNSIKHAFATMADPRDLRIDIDFAAEPADEDSAQSGGGHVLRYTDSGQGFDPTLAQRTGTGTMVIEALLEELHGSIDYCRENGRFLQILSFPDLR